jgi:hypothetical protein
MNFCPKCGQAGMRSITHICPPPIGPTPGPFAGVPPALDVYHWLYEAGYEQGYQDALKTRDLSPLGGGTTQ